MHYTVPLDLSVLLSDCRSLTISLSLWLYEQMEEDNSAEDVTNLSKKRSDKNSREQMRYRKILYLIDNIRDKLESVGVLTVSSLLLCARHLVLSIVLLQGKESKTEVISAAGAYINQMKRQCETYTDLRAFSNDFYG